eukprot:217760-Chlamydomonas_euryale.AAC.7
MAGLLGAEAGAGPWLWTSWLEGCSLLRSAASSPMLWFLNIAEPSKVSPAACASAKSAWLLYPPSVSTPLALKRPSTVFSSASPPRVNPGPLSGATPAGRPPLPAPDASISWFMRPACMLCDEPVLGGPAACSS